MKRVLFVAAALAVLSIGTNAGHAPLFDWSATMPGGFLASFREHLQACCSEAPALFWSSTILSLAAHAANWSRWQCVTGFQRCTSKANLCRLVD